jgi:predicted DNA-binding transcriptional regulator AlpA
MTSSDIEYIRPADARRFGLSRSSLYNLISDGKIQCRVIRRPGFKKPMRLINAEELRKYIESCIEKSPSK